MNKRKTKLLGLLFSVGVAQLLSANMLEDNLYAKTVASINVDSNWQQLITGTVMDEDGVPLSGASVLVKGTTNGVVADFDGKFSIEVDSESILVVSYVGFETKEIKVGLEKDLKITLAAGNALEEVVITALGIKKEKKRIGYATQEVKGVTLQKAITPNVLESMSGKVAGLTVISNGADFFSDPSIFLRGEKPILVVDGVPMPDTDFWNISSDDIENITVLKGAAASALYGSLGKFGALQITMKSGKGIDGTRVSVNSSTTFQTGFLRIPKAQTQYGPGNTGRYEFGTGAAGEVVSMTLIILFGVRNLMVD